MLVVCRRASPTHFSPAASALFFFFFLLGGASSRVARLRPSPPRPTAQRRVQSLDRPSPSRRSTGNSTASAWPRPLRRARLRARPSASGLGPSPAPSPAPRLCRNVAGLPARPGSARLGLPPASSPVASGAVPLAPPRLRLPSKTLPVGPAPMVTLGMGPSLGLPHPPPAPGPCLDKKLSLAQAPSSSLGWVGSTPHPPLPPSTPRPVSVLPNGPAPSSAFLNIPRLLPGHWKVLPASPPLPPSAPELNPPATSPPRKRPLPRNAPSLASPPV